MITKSLLSLILLCALQLCAESTPSISNLTPAQYVQRYQTPSGAQRIKPSNKPSIKARMPLGWRLAAQRNNVSFSLLSHQKVNHPGGGAVFPENGGLASAFNGLLQSVDNTPRASGYLRKVQFFALHDLFSHLVSVRSLFNLTHVDNAHDYLSAETNYALNKKAFIVGLLLNIIQAQLHQIILNYFPTLPTHLAGSAGMLIMSHDYGADLNFLIEDQESLFFDPSASPSQSTALKNSALAVQSQYLQVLNKYLNFFHGYTSYISQKDTASTMGTNMFYRYAATIAQSMAQNSIALQGKQIANMPANNVDEAKNKTRALRNYTCLHPGLFFYTPESLRAIKIIPIVMQELPQNIKGLGWPKQLTNAAQSGQRAKMKDGTPLNYAVAYFKGPQGERTSSEAGATGLFINIPTKNDLYEQEVSKQPAWLNSKEGILTIMRGCLGDIGALVGMNILDPCVEAIIIKAQSLVPGAGGPQWQQCSRHLELIKQARKEYVQKTSSTAADTEQIGKPELPTTEETESVSSIISP